MEVDWTRVMGPERVLPNSEEDLSQERSSEPVVADEWSGEDGEEEDVAPGEDEEQGSVGYYYQPLNQEPETANSLHTEQPDEASHAGQIQEVQERIEVTFTTESSVISDRLLKLVSSNNVVFILLFTIVCRLTYF